MKVAHVVTIVGTGERIGAAMEHASQQANEWLSTSGITTDDIHSVQVQTIDMVGKDPSFKRWTHTMTFIVTKR